MRVYAAAHKFLSALVIIMVLAGGYGGIKKFVSTSGETLYVMTAVTKGTLIASVTGSGQVLASSQVDLKPKASGDVMHVEVKNGQEVRAGTVVAQLDARDAEKAVRDAEVNLESSKLSLEKLEKSADDLSITQAENSLARAQESKKNAQDDLAKAYEDGFNNVANTFLDLPTIMSGLQDMLFSNNPALAPGGQWNVDYYASAAAPYNDQANGFKTDVYQKYQAARTAYDKNFQGYKSVSRFSDTAVIESSIDQTYQTTKNVAEAVKSANNLIQLYQDELTKRNLKPAALAGTHLSTLNTDTATTNGHLLSLLGVENTIKNSKEAIVNADRSIEENAKSLAKLKAGADPLDIESARLALKQRENALLDARQKLSDYFVRAPFDGTIAKLNVQKADLVASGAVVATLVTSQKLAQISLNEVDVSKIRVGQKVTLTFDAIEGLSISGEVAEIDTVGTVTQGVVTYNVKIGFDIQDDRVRPGMSVSAAVITDVKQDVLLVPNSAVKSSGGVHYVELFDTSLPASSDSRGVPSSVPPRRQPVEVGLSNDTHTEILSGLKEGDSVVTRTIPSSAASQNAPQAPSLFGAPRGGGGGLRIPRGD